MGLADVKNVQYSSVKPTNEDVQLPTIGVRHWQVLLLFCMVFCAFGFRVILSVAIIAMTSPDASSNPDIPTYGWEDKGTILSSFFWGYIWFQILTGYVVDRYGAKWFLVGCMTSASLLTVLTPLTAAKFGSVGMCVNRALQGACQSFLFPSLTHQLSQWVPTNERSRLGAFAFGAGPFGTVVAMLVTGHISASRYGWPLVFYLYGGLGIFWCLVFSVLGSNSPAEHRSISHTEKIYIEASLGHLDETTHKIPWKRIFTSIPVWALFIVQVGQNYCFWTLLTQIPNYFSHVIGFDIKNNSTLSAIPYLTLWILSFFFGYISDKIVNIGLLKRTASRKLFNTIGLLTPAAALIAVAYTNADQESQAVGLLIFAVGSNSAVVAGWQINHMDLSPNFAGTVMGITNGASHISAIVAPLMVGYLVTDEKDPLQWRRVFLLVAGIVTFCAIEFNVFGSGETQPWNHDENDEEYVAENA